MYSKKRGFLAWAMAGGALLFCAVLMSASVVNAAETTTVDPQAAEQQPQEQLVDFCKSFECAPGCGHTFCECYGGAPWCS